MNMFNFCASDDLPHGGFIKNAVQRYNFLANYANISGFFCNFAPKFKYLR